MNMIKKIIAAMMPRISKDEKMPIAAYAALLGGTAQESPSPERMMLLPKALQNASSQFCVSAHIDISIVPAFTH